MVKFVFFGQFELKNEPVLRIAKKFKFVLFNIYFIPKKFFSGFYEVFCHIFAFKANNSKNKVILRNYKNKGILDFKFKNMRKYLIKTTEKSFVKKKDIK